MHFYRFLRDGQALGNRLAGITAQHQAGDFQLAGRQRIAAKVLQCTLHRRGMAAVGQGRILQRPVLTQERQQPGRIQLHLAQVRSLEALIGA
ncbi:hypothetical protein D3C84_1079810 [compost metagenome]